MNNINDVRDYLSSVSLFDRETFITRACVDLINSMFEARETKGLETLQKNLSAIIDFASTMEFEIEAAVMRDNINSDFSSIRADIENDNLDDSLPLRLEKLSDSIREYLNIKCTTEDCDEADEQAYANIKSVLAANS